MLGDACHNAEQKKILPEIPVEEPVSFFPVTEFILGQLREIDSLPVTPLKINFDSNKQDSVWLKKEDIRKYASPFLHPVIDSVSMEDLFSGKSFLDQTINAFTFSYDAKTKLPDSIKLTHWDVYIDPLKSNVLRIYMVKEELINKEHITTQLTWKSDKWFSIRTIMQQPDRQPQIKEEMLKWDFND